MNTALRFDHVVKRYGKTRALDGLSLRVPLGGIFGLVGSNGAGKTTLLSVAAGQVRPQSGAVQVLERGPFDPLMHAGRVTLLPQDAYPPQYARVRHLLTYYARLQGLGPDETGPEVQDVLAGVNLADRATYRVRALSHGMKRRVAIAQAFLGSPDLVLLDEPMSGLDPVEVNNVRRLIRERKEGQTVVISSHLLFELQNLCDEVAIIERGRLMRQESMQSITRHNHRLVYRLETAPPLKRLRERVTHAVFTWDERARELVVTYQDGGLTPSALNAVILPVLLEASCHITEIIRGSDLESEYFESRGGRARRD